LDLGLLADPSSDPQLLELDGALQRLHEAGEAGPRMEAGVVLRCRTGEWNVSKTTFRASP
jgi:hypothetical protein